MDLVVLLGVVAVAGAVVARITWRQGADTRQSVRDYQQTLDTLRDMSDRNDARRVRPSRPVAPSEPRRGRAHRASRAAPAGGTPGRAEEASDELGDWSGATAAAVGGSEVFAFDDLSAPQPGAASASDRKALARVQRSSARHAPRHRPVGRHSRARRGRQRRRALVTFAVLAVVLLVAAGVYAASGSKSHAGRTGSATRASRAVGRAPARPLEPPSTALASVLSPVTSGASSALYRAPSGPYVLQVTVDSGACWVLATNPSSGVTVWTGTVSAATPERIPGDGTLRVELGAPTSTATTLDGVPVQYPSVYASPLILTFAPPGSAPDSGSVPPAGTGSS